MRPALGRWTQDIFHSKVSAKWSLGNQTRALPLSGVWLHGSKAMQGYSRVTQGLSLSLRWRNRAKRVVGLSSCGIAHPGVCCASCGPRGVCIPYSMHKKKRRIDQAYGPAQPLCDVGFWTLASLEPARRTPGMPSAVPEAEGGGRPGFTDGPIRTGRGHKCHQCRGYTPGSEPRRRCRAPSGEAPHRPWQMPRPRRPPPAPPSRSP